MFGVAAARYAALSRDAAGVLRKQANAERLRRVQERAVDIERLRARARELRDRQEPAVLVGGSRDAAKIPPRSPT